MSTTVKDRPILKLRKPKPRWIIETSHMVAVPKHIDAVDLADLRNQVQAIADSKKVRIDRPAMGTITFRYEHDMFDRVVTVHAYFTNKHGKLSRFMRLRKS